MPKYKVIAKAKFEYEPIDAPDEELAIEKAIELFDEAWDGNPIGLFQWEVARIGDLSAQEKREGIGQIDEQLEMLRAEERKLEKEAEDIWLSLPPEEE